MWKGIAKERDTRPFRTKTVGFDLNPSGKGTQRNPPGEKPHSVNGIPFSRCGRIELLFSRSRKKGTPRTGLKCCGTSSATSGLQISLKYDEGLDAFISKCPSIACHKEV